MNCLREVFRVFPAILASTLAVTMSLHGATVRISEVMAKNENSLKTVRGQTGLDWIELENTSDAEVDVCGWYLSDNPAKKPSKWAKIECAKGSAVVPPRGYLIVWADKSFDNYSSTEAHVAIGLSTDGESLFVAPPETTVLAEADLFVFGLQLKDVSFGVSAAGALRYFREPTPGSANSAKDFGPPTPTVSFSVPHGFLSAPTVVEMSAGASQGGIYYTLDGSAPTQENGSLYMAGGIVIDKSAILRASVPNADAVFQTVTTATYLFAGEVARQSKNPGAPFPSAENVNGQVLEFGMNTNVVASHHGEVLESLTNSTPVISIACDAAHLFDAATGIYVNPGAEGRAWERRVSVELFDPKGREDGFQLDAGLRIRGAYSRRGVVPKHSFRLFFRSEYGASKLEYPLFGDEGLKSFDKIDLRTSSNNSWSTDNSDNETFVHETFCRDTQRDQGQPYTRSKYYHLYLNGQYWGIYQTQERDDEKFAADYCGGEDGDWDVIRTSSSYGRYYTSVAAGNWQAWDALVSMINRGVDDATYFRLQGQNPNGEENPLYPVYLNAENLMDYMIGLHYENDPDGPWSIWNGFPNNLHSLHNRAAREGFLWLRHDAEFTMGKCGYSPESSCLLWGVRSGAYNRSNLNPAGLHARLMDGSRRYWRQYTDRLQAQCFQRGGVLSAEVAQKRFRERMAEVDGAIWAECARWGRGNKTKTTWSNACSRCTEGFIPKRAAQLKRFYRAQGWFPKIDAPEPSVVGGEVEYASTVAFAAMAGSEIFWTDDGSDPMDANENAGKTAHHGAEYVMGASEAVTLQARSRSKETGEWSALTRIDLRLAPMSLPARQHAYLRVAEVMAYPMEGEKSFLVLTNLSCTESVGVSNLLFRVESVAGAQDGFDVSLAKDDRVLAPGAALRICADDLGAQAEFPKEGFCLTLKDAEGRRIQTGRIDALWPGLALAKGFGAGYAAATCGRELGNASDWRLSWWPSAQMTLRVEPTGEEMRISAIARVTSLDLRACGRVQVHMKVWEEATCVAEGDWPGVAEPGDFRVEVTNVAASANCKLEAQVLLSDWDDAVLAEGTHYWVNADDSNWMEHAEDQRVVAAVEDETMAQDLLAWMYRRGIGVKEASESRRTFCSMALDAERLIEDREWDALDMELAAPKLELDKREVQITLRIFGPEIGPMIRPECLMQVFELQMSEDLRDWTSTRLGVSSITRSPEGGLNWRLNCAEMKLPRQEFFRILMK